MKIKSYKNKIQIPVLYDHKFERLKIKTTFIYLVYTQRRKLERNTTKYYQWLCPHLSFRGYYEFSYLIFKMFWLPTTLRIKPIDFKCPSTSLEGSLVYPYI